MKQEHQDSDQELCRNDSIWRFFTLGLATCNWSCSCRRTVNRERITGSYSACNLELRTCNCSISRTEDRWRTTLFWAATSGFLFLSAQRFICLQLGTCNSQLFFRRTALAWALRNLDQWRRTWKHSIGTNSRSSKNSF